MYVADRAKWLSKLLTQEALNVLTADDFDIFSGGSGILNYDGGTVIFKVGETVEGAGGNTGVIAAVVGNAATGYLVLNECTGLFNNNEALTGNVSPNGAAVANGNLDPHTGNWTGFTVGSAAVFASLRTGGGSKNANLAGHTFGVAFSCIADLRSIQLTSGVIMAHKIKES